MKRRKVTGFTIVELLIVVVVIAILAAVTIVAYNGVTQKATASSLQSQLTQIYKAVSNYYTTNNAFPAQLADANVKPQAGTSYTYGFDNPSNPTAWCASATINSIMYRVASDSSVPILGNCSGYFACSAGFVLVPGNTTFGTSDFCVAKYEAKNVGGMAVSQAAGTPWVSINQTDAITAAAAACSGCHLITEAEWMTVATDLYNVASNWTGGAVGSGSLYLGNNDGVPGTPLDASADDTNGYYGTGNAAGSDQRRTFYLSNGNVIWDLTGNAYDWTQGTIAAGQQPGLSSDSAYSWKSWNNSFLNMYGLPATSQPNAMNASAISWSSKGLGSLYSNHADTSTRGFLRGGHYGNTTNGGLFTLNLNYRPSDPAAAHTTFRMAK